jgi:hypothetical protein
VIELLEKAKDLEARDEVTYEELHPFRVAVAWRLVRRIARLTGLVDEDQTLAVGTKPHPCPWISPTDIFKGTPIPLSDTPERVCYDIVADQGITLMPDGSEKYSAVMNIIGQMLGVLDHPIGRLGCDGLLELFPCKTEILTFEANMVQHVLKLLATEGFLKTQEQLGELGLLPIEAIELVLLARKAVGALRERMDPEHDRLLMEVALHDFISRAREAMNLGAEMQAMKLKGLLFGLTRNEPEDENLESIRIITKVGREANRSRLQRERTCEGEFTPCCADRVLAPRSLTPTHAGPRGFGGIPPHGHIPCPISPSPLQGPACGLSGCVR